MTATVDEVLGVRPDRWRRRRETSLDGARGDDGLPDAGEVRMLLALVGLLFAVPVLWAVSVGAVREVRRARDRDPRVGCQAWVAVPGSGARRYRCCEPVFAGGALCRRHEVERARAAPPAHEQNEATTAAEPASDPTVAPPGTEPIDEPQAVGRALTQARIGIPLALLALVGAVLLVLWVVVGTR